MKFIISLFKRTKSILQHPLVGDAGIFTVSQYIAAGLSFITTIVVARILGAEGYGRVSLIMVYPSLLWSFLGIKSLSVTTRYISSFRSTGRNEEIKSICKLGYGVDFFVSLVTFIIVSVTAGWVVQYIHLPSQKAWLMVIYAASFPLFSLAGTSWAIFSSWGMWRAISALQILDKIITFIIVLGFLLSGFRVAGVVLGTAISQIIFGLLMASIATYILYRDGFGLWWRTSLNSIVSLRKELTAFLGWNYLLVSLNGFIAQIPLIILGYLRGPKEAGFYRLAVSLTMIGCYLESSLGKVIYPILSVYCSEGEYENLKKTLKRWTLQGGLPIGILLLLIVPLLPIMVPVLFGSSYEPMILGVQIMMVASVVGIVFFWLLQFYYASGRIALWTKGYAIYTTIVIGLGWFCIRRWGFSGLAILVSMSKLVFTLVMALGFKENLFRRIKGAVRHTIDNHKIVCFTFWFPNHHNPRYTGLFPKFASVVKFYKITLSHQRIIRALEYHIWQALKRRFIYPIILGILSRRYKTLFCVDLHQIPSWTKKNSIVVDMERPCFSNIEIKLLNLAQVKAIIVSMERMREIFQELGIFKPIYVIPQGVVMDYIDAFRIKEISLKFKEKQDVVVGYHAPTLTLSCDGPLRARQGLDDLDFLLTAVEEARKTEPHIKVWLFGEASKSLKKYVLQGNKSWIKLFGYIPYRSILNYVANFDIGAYPRMCLDSIRFREKIAEYMACGIPIVVTNIEDGPRMIIKKARCGIICDSQEDFTKALVKLACSSEMRQELGRAGQRYASENLDWSILVKRYEQILNEV